ncbi:MAG: Hsp20/alpha crystallin family protein [Verrucomicrobiota bacterium]
MALLTKRGRETRPALRRGERAPLTFRDEMNRLFDDFFYGMEAPVLPEARAALTREFVPSVDVSETDGQVKVSAELPGMSEKDVNVELDEDMVTISGEKKTEEEDEEGGRYWRESSYGSFVREVPLPSAVDMDKAEAKFKNGVLNVIMPKAEEEKEKRKKIEVSSE